MHDPADLVAYARRDWSLLSRANATYWRAWKKKHGAKGSIRMADQLRKQVIASRPGWPSVADRRADLASHVRVAEALSRVPRRRR